MRFMIRKGLLAMLSKLASFHVYWISTLFFEENRRELLPVQSESETSTLPIIPRLQAHNKSLNLCFVERRHSERTCLALLPCHFQVQILGTKNGSCAAGTPPASQGGWIFGISVFHHCGWHHEGQVRDRASLYWCFSNPNCDFFCSRRRTPPSPPSTPSWTSSCG